MMTRFERDNLLNIKLFVRICLGDCEDASSNSILSWSLIKELYSWCYPRGNVIRLPSGPPMYSNVRIIAFFVSSFPVVHSYISINIVSAK